MRETKKKVQVAAAALFAAFAAVAADNAKISFAQARGNINGAIADRSVMMSTMKSLSAADQVSFLAAVNSAIAKSPGSKEDRSAKFLKANTAALKAAKDGKGNMKALLAEVFATASVNSLCAISEYFAKNLFNRSADPSKTYTDESFAKIASAALKAVSERCEGVDNSSVRITFAVLMFMRASGGSSDELKDELVMFVPQADRKASSEEWIPSALGEDGKDKTYEPMLAVADSDSEPDLKVVLRLTGIQQHDAVIGSLSDGAVAGAGSFSQQIASPQAPSETGSDMSEPHPLPYQGQKF